MPAPAKSVGGEASAVHHRDDGRSEPLQALDALRNGLAAAIEDQFVHADRRESPDVAGDLFRLAGEGPAGSVRRWDTGVIEWCIERDRQRREIAPLGLSQPVSACRDARASLAA